MLRGSGLLALLAGLVLTIALGGCGADERIVRFEGMPHASITRSMLDHWMKSTVAGDFRRNIAFEGPAGLASDPADYPRCVAVAAKLVASRPSSERPTTDRADLTQKCHQLHRAVEAQALGFLISARWTLAEAAEHHIAASHAEISQAFAVARAQQYPNEEALHRYLTENRISLADLLYQIKLDVLAGKLVSRLQAQISGRSGGERAYAALALANYRRIVERTDCSTGYVVPGCRGYDGPTLILPSPDIVLKLLVNKKPG